MKTILLLLFILLVTGCRQQDVTPKPIAGFTFEYKPSPALPGQVLFYNTSKNATAYQWEFGDGQVNTGENPTALYEANGRYIVTLTAKNTNGDQDRIQQNVEITSFPTTGDAIFWSTLNETIDVSVSNVPVGTNVRYRTVETAPACGAEGFVTVTRPAGTFSFTAKTRALIPATWSGQITVVNGQCRSMRLTK